MKQLAHWTLTVSSDLDRRVRSYLTSAGRKGDMAAFVEEAVRARLLQLSMKTLPVYSRRSANDVQPEVVGEPSVVTKIGEGRHGN
jgi:Ribbon-helix-helix domain